LRTNEESLKNVKGEDDTIIPRINVTDVRNKSRHWGVKGYWREYQSIPELSVVTNRSNFKQICKHFNRLMSSTDDKIPVFKVLRLWGKLEILRSTYPSSTIIHLWRDLDAQKNSYDRAKFPLDYFGEWKYGYAKQNYHPVKGPDLLYKRVWNLCKSEGQEVCDVSIKYEDLISDPFKNLHKVLKVCGLEKYTESVQHLIVRPPPYSSKKT